MDCLQCVDILLTLDLFKGFRRDALEQMLSHGNHQTETLKAGQKFSAKVPSLFVALEGKIEIRTNAAKRHSVMLRTLSAPDVFGAAALFDKKKVPDTTVYAQTNATILQIEKELVFSWLTENPDFLARYLALLADRVRFLNARIRAFTAGSAERRIARFLLVQKTDEFLLPCSLLKLASALDIGRASLYRAFERMEEEGLIQKDGKTIKICDRTALDARYK